VKFLHTSDWHIGKTIAGQSRLDEQRDVLAEIIDIAKKHDVDAVLIAGDLFESSAPSPAAQQLVISALLALHNAGIEVVTMAGNHDHAGLFDAYRPLMDALGIRIVGAPRPADAGGIVEFTARSTGERVQVAVLPFISQRYAVRAAELISQTPAESSATYDQKIRDVIAHLETGLTPGAVHVVMAHLMVTGGVLGGGERTAQTIMEYFVPASAFGVQPHYVALGHLHRRQQIPAACPVHYSGSPMALDFGEQENRNVVVLAEAHPDTPVSLTDLPITAGRRLRTVTGTAADLESRAGEFADDFLRVVLTEPNRAGLREQIQQALPNAVQIRVVSDGTERSGRERLAAQTGKSPSQLFCEYLEQAGITDARVAALFDQLHDELTTTDPGELGVSPLAGER
jgi:exonuclease SbcD